MKTNLKKSIVFLALSMLSTACFSLGGEKKETGENSMSSLNDGDVPGTGVLTVSVPTSTQFMPHMISLTGLTQAQVTTNTRNAFSAKFGLFSLNGDAESISGPVQLATISLGGEFCDDILDVEVPLAAPQRRYFSGVNFGAGLNSLTLAMREDVMRSMSRKFWGRDADSAEVSLLQAGLTDAFSSANQTQSAETRRMMFYLCSVMLSSSSAHTL